VCIVTGVDPDGGYAGLAVGSFTSVSLDPPLVAFLVDRESTSWPRIRRAESFSVNVLAADQEHLCRAFAVKGGDKFDGLHFRTGKSGAPIFDGVIAWIDCDIETVHAAGDHYIVIGRVRDLDVENSTLPLLFFQGGYGRFVPQSLATADRTLLERFREVDKVRPELEALAHATDVEATATVLMGTEIVVIATAGQPRDPHIPTRVGNRYAFVPPTGAPFAAWARNDVAATWLNRALPASAQPELRANLDYIRQSGYSFLIGSLNLSDKPSDAIYEGTPRELRRIVSDVRIAAKPEDLVRTDPTPTWAALSAPAFDADRNVCLAISLTGFSTSVDAEEIERSIEHLRRTANRITALAGASRQPLPSSTQTL
jgi:flavin reductase (DIM6/NTAB) family NADH-FMN oxidoreductase RutF